MYLWHYVHFSQAFGVWNSDKEEDLKINPEIPCKNRWCWLWKRRSANFWTFLFRPLSYFWCHFWRHFSFCKLIRFAFLSVFFLDSIVFPWILRSRLVCFWCFLRLRSWFCELGMRRPFFSKLWFFVGAHHREQNWYKVFLAYTYPSSDI